MATYGSFQHDTQNDIYTGRINFGGFKADAKLVPNPDKDSENKADDSKPDYLLLDGSAQIGAAWKKIAETSQNRYLSVKVDTPMLDKAIWCKLSKTKNTAPNEYLLFWSR